MIRISDIFQQTGKNTYDEFVDSVMQWQDQVFQLATKQRPELADEIKFYRHVPLELLSVRDRIMMTGRYRDLIGFDNLLESMGSKTVQSSNPNFGGIFDTLGRIIGPSKTTRIQNMLSRMTQYTDGVSGYGRLPLEVDADMPLLENIYRNMNIQVRDYFSPVFSGMEGRIEDASASRFLGFGRSSIGVTSRGQVSAATFSPGSLVGKNYTIFDIETAGLDAGQIREIAYSTQAGSQEVIRFRPQQFSRGSSRYEDIITGLVRDIGLEEEYALTLSPTEKAKYFSLPSRGTGDDFLNGIEPFLRQIENSDYIIGQNISKFDIENIFVSISRTSRYKNDSSYKSYIDSIYKDIVDNNKIVDTLELARSNRNLQGLPVAKEFIDRGELKPFSIENLILETDLIDYLKDPTGQNRPGIEVFRDLVSRGGLHTAEVDVAVTTALLENYQNLSIKSLGDNAVRKAVLSSAALLPITNIDDISKISDVVLRKALEASLDPNSQIIQNASQSSQDVIEEYRQGNRSLAEVRAALGHDSAARYNLNRLENLSLSQRDLGRGLNIGSPAKVSMDATMQGFGDFDRLTKRNQTAFMRAVKKKSYLDMYNYGDDVTSQDYANFQQTMTGKQMPWAGLSYEERKIGSAISGITSSISKNTAAAPFMQDLMISNFENINAESFSFLTGNTGRATLPASILRAQGILEQGDILSYSIIRPSVASDITRVSLVRAMNKADADRISQYMYELAYKSNNDIEIMKYIHGLDPSMSEKDVIDYLVTTSSEDEVGISKEISSRASAFRENLRKSIQRETDIVKGLDPTAGEAEVIESISAKMQSRGVSIGEVGGKQAEELVAVIAAASNQSAQNVTEENMFKIGTAFVDENTGTVRATGAFAIKGLNATDKGHIVGQVGLVLDHEENINNMTVLQRSRARSIGNAVSNDAIERINRIHNSIISNKSTITKGVLATAGLAAALMMYKRKKQQDTYDQVMQQMPMETGTGYSVYDQLEVKKQLGVNKYYQSYDPLATAYTVEQLDNAKIGHTNMSYNRNNNLYGGVL